MKAVIPTGGRGTRMQPVTFSCNKHFIPIANKPLIFYPIETIAELGIKEVAITYNPGWLEAVKSYLGDGSRWGLKFTYVLQEKPAGLANIFQVCEEFLAGDSFVFHLGDNIFVDGLKELAEYFLKKKPNALVTMVKVKKGENKRMGVPYLDKRGRLKEYVEKPKIPPNDYGIPGVYFFDNNVFRCFRGKDRIKPSARGELEIGAPYNWLIDHGYGVDVLEYKGKWLDPGKFGDWIQANQYLLDDRAILDVKGKVDKDSRIEGRVELGKGSRVINSIIRGPSILGKECLIKDSYIGPYSSLDNGCVINDSQIENSVLMERVRIDGIRKPITGSLIGSESEVRGANGPGNIVKLMLDQKSVVKI